MIYLIAIWILIFFIITTLGVITLRLYNRFSKTKDEYNYLDLFILGLSMSAIIVGFVSLFHPINYITTTCLLILSILYWIVNLTTAKKIITNWKTHLKTYRTSHIFLFLLFTISVVVYNIITPYSFDSLYYHYQHTAWNEQYPVIKGLANLETRFGFNSNHLLISALFAFSKHLGEPLYAIQSLYSLLLGYWIINECLKSRQDIKRIILFVLFSIFYFTFSSQITASSTDIIFTLTIFYFGVKLLLYADTFVENKILFAITPIFLITVKFSSAIFLLSSLLIFISLWREKNIKAIGFISTMSLLIVIPWLIRNVIISGYLIYPISFIDLFNYDWKVPQFALELEKNYIIDYAWERFKAIITLGLFRDYLNGNQWIFFNVWFSELVAHILFIITFVSPLIFINQLKKKKLPLAHTAMYIILVVSMIAIFVSAPDFRFASGSIYLLVYFSFFYIPFSYIKKTTIIVPYLCCIILLLGAVKNIHDLRIQHQNNRSHRPLSSMLIKPYGIKALKNISIESFDKYQLGEITIYMSQPSAGGVTYDFLPASYTTNPAEKMNTQKKFLPIQAIEARGETIEEGFRPITNVENGWWIRKKDWWNKH